MFKNTVKLVILCGLAILLTLPTFGCSKKTVKVSEAEQPVKVEEPAATQPAPGAESEAGQMESGVINEGAGPAESLESKPMENESMGMVEGSRTSIGLLPVYFDFDKSVIRMDQVQRMEANAAFLKGNNDRIRIEGNCDERGTNEYNMALGERRAMSAKKYLINLGISASRLTTISYGEERPINLGHDELAWSQNRRDDFVIVQ